MSLSSRAGADVSWLPALVVIIISSPFLLQRRAMNTFKTKKKCLANNYVPWRQKQRIESSSFGYEWGIMVTGRCQDTKGSRLIFVWLFFERRTWERVEKWACNDQEGTHDYFKEHNVMLLRRCMIRLENELLACMHEWEGAHPFFGLGSTIFEKAVGSFGAIKAELETSS